jgi:DnaJ-class molecular chaperone
VIRAAYRCLAQQDHPDKNQDSEAAGLRMTSINHAYAVLSDQARRKAYDLSQGISQALCERRDLGPQTAVQRSSRSKGPPTARPFAFRPMD